MTVGILLSSHARPHTLRPQLAAIDAQTVQPSELVIFHDHADGVKFDYEAARGRRIIATNWPSGVWNRYSFCLYGLKSEYVALFDDDTLPGRRWLEDCLKWYGQVRGVYGANGVRFLNGSREKREYYGFSQPTTLPFNVDIVGHAVFFPRAILTEFCALPRLDEIDTAGEDYHLAFTAQQLKLSVFSMPQGRHDISGSIDSDLGTDSAALYRQPGEEEKKQRVHDFYLSQGWKPLALRKDSCVPANS